MPRSSQPERRRKSRMKLPQIVRVRPSHFSDDDFDEVLPTLNVSRSSIYFASHHNSYFKGMRLVVTFPYSTAPGALNREFIGEVVRIDPLAGELRSIAVHLVMPLHIELVPSPRNSSAR